MIWYLTPKSFVVRNHHPFNPPLKRPWRRCFHHPSSRFLCRYSFRGWFSNPGHTESAEGGLPSKGHTHVFWGGSFNRTCGLSPTVKVLKAVFWIGLIFAKSDLLNWSLIPMRSPHERMNDANAASFRFRNRSTKRDRPKTNCNKTKQPWPSARKREDSYLQISQKSLGTSKCFIQSKNMGCRSLGARHKAQPVDEDTLVLNHANHILTTSDWWQRTRMIFLFMAQTLRHWWANTFQVVQDFSQDQRF